MDLKNSTVLITGGTSGIGLELARQLLEQGANVIVTGRNPDSLAAAKTKFPKLHTFRSDVCNPGDIEQLYMDVTRNFPTLNIIVNNAGVMRLIDLQDTAPDLDDIDREIVTNLSGTVRMVHQFLPHLLKMRSAAIVNVSSAIAFMSYSSAPVYSAAKAGVRAYTQALRLQLAETNVKVFEMIPPGVKTNLQNDWTLQPDQRMMMDADRMVGAAVRALLKDKPELKPKIVSIIKFAGRLVPGLLLNFGHRDFKKFRTINQEKK